MRLKTLGVLLVTALAAFTMIYWLTDEPRRATTAATQEEELLHFGEIIFSNNPAEPAAAGCAQCHGADGTGGEAGAAVSYGGVVVSGNVNSQMPAWSAEVGGPLNQQQIDAVVALVESWAAEAANQPQEDIPNTVEAGAEVYASAGCASCHGPDLAGTPAGPDITGIKTDVITEGLPVTPSGVDQMIADYQSDPRMFLENWIRDSAANYNDGQPTGMPPHPESSLSQSALQALISFLLDDTGE